MTLEITGFGVYECLALDEKRDLRLRDDSRSPQVMRSVETRYREFLRDEDRGCVCRPKQPIGFMLFQKIPSGWLTRLICVM